PGELKTFGRYGAGPAVRDEIAKDAGRPRDTAEAVKRAHEVAAAIIGTDRFGYQHILATKCALPQPIGPDRPPVAVEKHVPIAFGHAKRLLRGDEDATLRGARDADGKFPVGRRLPRARRWNGAGAENERKQGEIARHARSIAHSPMRCSSQSSARTCRYPKATTGKVCGKLL